MIPGVGCNVCSLWYVDQEGNKGIGGGWGYVSNLNLIYHNHIIYSFRHFPFPYKGRFPFTIYITFHHGPSTCTKLSTQLMEDDRFSVTKIQIKRFNTAQHTCGHAPSTFTHAHRHTRTNLAILFNMIRSIN